MIIQNNKDSFNDILIEEFNYHLSSKKIAQFPLEERDQSKMLVWKDQCIKDDQFINLTEHLNSNSFLVINNTKVLKARLLFKKQTGATIEVFCLEPLELLTTNVCKAQWKCLIKNGKKWKNETLTITYTTSTDITTLTAKKISQEDEINSIEFSWNQLNKSFIEILDLLGHTPLPPYINRIDNITDSVRYQTIFAKQFGSVAAPTAGLHFTEKTYSSIKKKEIDVEEITLHVGIGTFKPISTENIKDHTMHAEHICVSHSFLVKLLQQLKSGPIIAIGTTTTRTLESLYWLGCKIKKTSNNSFLIAQWEPYINKSTIPATVAIENIINYLNKNNQEYISASTQIMIIPGYSFKIVTGLLTNFHQPKSTLLLLISAFCNNNWKAIYTHALNNNYRFLSYGDCCLFLNQ